MATEYSQTENNNNQIEINNVIINDDTIEDTAIETTVNNVMNNIERNNDSIDILRSSDQYKFFVNVLSPTAIHVKKRPLMNEQQQPTLVKTLTKLCMQLLV